MSWRSHSVCRRYSSGDVVVAVGDRDIFGDVTGLQVRRVNPEAIVKPSHLKDIVTSRRDDAVDNVRALVQLSLSSCHAKRAQTRLMHLNLHAPKELNLLLC